MPLWMPSPTSSSPDLPEPSPRRNEQPAAFSLSFPDALTVVTDVQLRILTACSQTAALSGYDRPDLRGLHLASLVEENDRFRVLRAGTLAQVGLRQEASVALATGAGTYVDFVAEVYTVRWNGKPCLLWTFTDRAKLGTSASPTLN